MNRETYPSAQSPLQGDIDGPAGATQVRVTGLRAVPIAPIPPLDHQKLEFDDATNRWIPVSPANQSISINGIVVSDDYDISFNLSLGTTNSPVFFNGV